jgi:toxin FitB
VSATSLEQWLVQLCQRDQARLLSVSMEIAEEWGRMNAITPLSTIDSLMAATAKVHQLILVSRNTKDIASSGVQCLNPFKPQ